MTYVESLNEVTLEDLRKRVEFGVDNIGKFFSEDEKDSDEYKELIELGVDKLINELSLSEPDVAERLYRELYPDTE